MEMPMGNLLISIGFGSPLAQASQESHAGCLVGLSMKSLPQKTNGFSRRASPNRGGALTILSPSKVNILGPTETYYALRNVRWIIFDVRDKGWTKQFVVHGIAILDEY